VSPRPRQVFTAITLLLSGKSDERDNGRRGGGGVGLRVNPFSFFDFYFWDPYYMQRRRALLAADPGHEMGFLEARSASSTRAAAHDVARRIC
jgi:hypothetical protein